MIPVLHLNCTKIPFSRVHAVLSDRIKYILIYLHRLKLNTCMCLCVNIWYDGHVSVSVCVYAHREHPSTSSLDFKHCSRLIAE